MGIGVFGVAVFISCPSFVKTLDQEGRRAMKRHDVADIRRFERSDFKGNLELLH